jgi:hypothetical protein
VNLCINLVLFCLQRHEHRPDNKPHPEIAEAIKNNPSDQFEQSQKYQLERINFRIINAIWNTAVWVGLWAAFVPAWLWDSIDGKMAEWEWCPETI